MDLVIATIFLALLTLGGWFGGRVYNQVASRVQIPSRSASEAIEVGLGSNARSASEPELKHPEPA